MSSEDGGTLERAGQWILAVGILVVNALKTALLWPYGVLKTYLDVGEKRRQEASGGDEKDGDG